MKTARRFTAWTEMVAWAGTILSIVGLSTSIAVWLGLSPEILWSLLAAAIAFVAGLTSEKLAQLLRKVQRTPRVFIAHSLHDTPFVEKLSHALKKDGAEVWLDAVYPGSGEPLTAAVTRALAETDYLVVVLSDQLDAAAARNLRLESDRLRAIPVVLGSQVPTDLTSSQVIVAGYDADRAAERILQSSKSVG